VGGIPMSKKKLGSINEEEVRFWTEITKGKLDRKDILIYNLLRFNGRLSDTEIARILNLSPSTVRRRRIRMEKEGYLKILGLLIFQYTDIVYADLIVSFDIKCPNNEIMAFLEECKNNPRIYEIAIYAGNKVILRFFDRDLKALTKHVREYMSNRPCVKDYEIYIISESPKLFTITMHK